MADICEMEQFDALPRKVRRFLNDCHSPFPIWYVQERLDLFGRDECLALLEDDDAERIQRYREEMGLADFK